MFSGAEGA